MVDRVQEDGGWNAHYAFMTLMSAGIAILGLLLSSPAVVIGAMLISPLMGPIVALGFAIATFDSREIRRTVVALAAGVLLAVLFCSLIVVLSPLQTVTSEIAARTRPNLFDLLVALFSGLAGAYAMIRGRHGAIVGVAIATALMPPLATIGFGLATTNGTVFFGALLLFFTNLMIIALAAAIIARLYGFGHRLSPRQTRLQATLLVLTFVALAVPLGLALRQIAWEALASRASHEVIRAQFGEDSRIQDLAIDYASQPIRIDATVLTPEYRPNSEREASGALGQRLGRPVRVLIDQLRVGTREIEASQLAAARSTIEARATGRIADRLALVAGVTPDDVVLDRSGSRAVVRAVALPDATLATYRALETRVGAAEPDWTVTLTPPVAPLPGVSFQDGELDEAGRAAVATAIWASQRLGLEIAVSGPADEAEAVLGLMREAGVNARGTGNGSAVEMRWVVPSEPAAGSP